MSHFHCNYVIWQNKLVREICILTFTCSLVNRFTHRKVNFIQIFSYPIEQTYMTWRVNYLHIKCVKQNLVFLTPTFFYCDYTLYWYLYCYQFHMCSYSPLIWIPILCQYVNPPCAFLGFSIWMSWTYGKRDH